MGFWNFKQIWISSFENKESILRQLLECGGCDLNAPRIGMDGRGGYIYDEFDHIHDEFDIWQYVPGHKKFAVIGGRIHDRSLSGDALQDVRELVGIIYRLSPETVIYYEEANGNNTSDAYFREEHIWEPENSTERIGHYDYCYGDMTAYRYDGSEYDAETDGKTDIAEWSTTKTTLRSDTETPSADILLDIIDEANKRGYTELADLIRNILNGIYGNI